MRWRRRFLGHIGKSPKRNLRTLTKKTEASWKWEGLYSGTSLQLSIFFASHLKEAVYNLVVMIKESVSSTVRQEKNILEYMSTQTLVLVE